MSFSGTSSNNNSNQESVTNSVKRWEEEMWDGGWDGIGDKIDPIVSQGEESGREEGEDSMMTPMRNQNFKAFQDMEAISNLSEAREEDEEGSAISHVSPSIASNRSSSYQNSTLRPHHRNKDPSDRFQSFPSTQAPKLSKSYSNPTPSLTVSHSPETEFHSRRAKSSISSTDSKPVSSHSLPYPYAYSYLSSPPRLGRHPDEKRRGSDGDLPSRLRSSGSEEGTSIRLVIDGGFRDFEQEVNEGLEKARKSFDEGSMMDDEREDLFSSGGSGSLTGGGGGGSNTSRKGLVGGLETIRESHSREASLNGGVVKGFVGEVMKHVGNGNQNKKVSSLPVMLNTASKSTLMTTTTTNTSSPSSPPTPSSPSMPIQKPHSASHRGSIPTVSPNTPSSTLIEIISTNSSISNSLNSYSSSNSSIPQMTKIEGNGPSAIRSAVEEEKKFRNGRRVSIGGTTIEERAFQLSRKLWEEDENVLKREKIAEFLGGLGDFKSFTRENWIKNFDFRNLSLEISLRKLFEKLVLWKVESQMVDRILESFARRWWEGNEGHVLGNPDVVHSISYSILLLNTDLHVVESKEKMSQKQFVKNTMGAIHQSRSSELEGVMDNRIGIGEENWKLKSRSVVSLRLADGTSENQTMGEMIGGGLDLRRGSLDQSYPSSDLSSINNFSQGALNPIIKRLSSSNLTSSPSTSFRSTSGGIPRSKRSGSLGSWKENFVGGSADGSGSIVNSPNVAEFNLKEEILNGGNGNGGISGNSSMIKLPRLNTANSDTSNHASTSGGFMGGLVYSKWWDGEIEGILKVCCMTLWRVLRNE
jgi:hypothetical protein